MRNALLAAAACAAVFGLTGIAPVNAAEIVIDVQSEASLVQQVATAVKQLQTLDDQYQELVATYQQVQQQYQMLTTFANPNGVATELEQPFLQNPMPSSTSVPGAVTGGTAPSAGFAQQFYKANHVYTPTGTSQAAQLQTEQSDALASIEGMAATNLQSIEQRISGLTDLQNQLNGATTLQQVASINARIGTEQNYISAQQAQAANLNAITTAQVAAQARAQQQAVSQDAEETAAHFPISSP
jgi:type IV secretion system protein VirB5